MANALKRGPLVQLLKSLFSGGTDVTTTTTTGTYRLPDVGDTLEGMQSFVQHKFSQFEHQTSGSWLSHFLESVLVIGVATALLVVFRDDQKWAKVVSLFSVGPTNNNTYEEDINKVLSFSLRSILRCIDPSIPCISSHSLLPPYPILYHYLYPSISRSPPTWS